MSITPLPPAPLRSDTQSVWDTKAFNFTQALPPFATELNSLAEDVAANALAGLISELNLTDIAGYVIGVNLAGDGLVGVELTEYDPITVAAFKAGTATDEGPISAAKARAAIIGQVVALGGNSPTPDLATGLQFEHTWTDDGVIGNPTNVERGMTVTIFIVQDATGGRAVTFGANWKFDGTPAIDTAANAVTMVVGTAYQTDHIIARVV